MKQRIIIAGPTASGKSTLAVELAAQIDGEIISVDSRQCYKQINIGTAKPTPEQLERVPHYNISILDLDEEDSASRFYDRAEEWAREIEQRNKTVIFAGGSTLHLQSLIRPFDDLPSSDPGNIKKLNAAAEEKGIEYLFNKLKNADPEYAEKMDGMNRQRIIRALDVWMQTGRPFSEFHTNENFTKPENYSTFALHRPRKELHKRIEMRCDEMIGSGLIEETRQLLKDGYSKELQALQTVGYRQIIQYLDGEISKEQMIKDFKTATRRYAKRQITWLRRWPFLNWLNCNELSLAEMVKSIQHQVAADVNKR